MPNSAPAHESTPFGPPEPRALPAPAAIAAEILRQATACAPGRSISPEDVARALGGEDWHPVLAPVRKQALAMATEGLLLILRKGKPVPPEQAKGVIRLAAPGNAA